MAVEFFLNPIVQTMLNGRTVNVPAVYTKRTAGERVSNIMPNPNGAGKNWTISLVENPTQATLDAIKADGTITQLPWNSDTLDNPVSTLTPAQRTAVTNALDARRIPTGWITLDTTIRTVLRFTLRLLDMVTLLKADFPEADLTQPWNTFSTAQRTRIRNALLTVGVDPTGLGVTGTTTIGEALLRVVNARMGEPVIVGPITI